MLDKNGCLVSNDKAIKSRIHLRCPKVFKLMQVHENEEGQAVSLAKDAKRVPSLLRTRDTKNNK